MTAFLFRAGSGVPGDCTRPANSTIETGFLDPAFFDLPGPTLFGSIVFTSVTANGTFFKTTQDDTTTPAANFYGILVRMAPSSAGSLDQSFGSGVPNIDNPQGIGKKGYFNVVIETSATAVLRGQPVYLRTVAGAGPGEDIGNLSATAVLGETEILPGVVWGVDGTDADNVAEIHIQ